LLNERVALESIASNRASTGCSYNNTVKRPRLASILFDKAVVMISMSAFHSMLIPILAGMILLAIGFNFRDKNAGIFSMWIGMLLILATVIYKILAKLAE
jgi:hypothetical protein